MYYLRRRFTYRAPADDRGDDWTPTGPDAIVADPPPKDEADKGLKGAADEHLDDETETAEEAAERVAAEAAAAAAAAETKKSSGKRIPLDRHQAVVDKIRSDAAAERDRLETELAKYTVGAKIADVNAKVDAAEATLVELETLYAKQLLENEPGKAAETMSKIRRTERAINEQTAQVREQAAEARAVERVRYDTTVERLEEQFPQLVPEHADFDRAKTAEVLELKEAFQSKGYTPSAALQKAVKYIFPPATKAQEKATEVEARVDPAAVAAQRKADAAAKTAAAIGKTPANVSGVGKDSDAAGGGITAKDVLKMSQKDFNSLDEKTLSRMRGDEL